jgi:hypothetical protein
MSGVDDHDGDADADPDTDDNPDSGRCGAECVDGSPCQNRVGSCPVPSHTDPDAENPGRPTEFTDERARLAIAAARDEGKSKAGCERAAGVGDGTIGGWLEANPTFEADDGTEQTFSRAFALARAAGESMYIEDGRREYGDTSFAKFMLSSSFGYEKSEKRKTEHSGEIDGFEFVYPSDAENGTDGGEHGDSPRES